MEIFEDNEDRTTFLENLSKVIERFNWICHGYCLMGNHYHLIIETPDPNLAKGMCQLGGVYSRKANRKRQRQGHLFQGRYRSVLIEKDEHFLELIRYLAMNPVKAGFVEFPGEWIWGSYSFIINNTPAPAFMSESFSLSFFSGDMQEARMRLKEFVETEPVSNEYSETYGKILFGGNRLKDEIGRHISVENMPRDIPKSQRFFLRPSLDEVFAGVHDSSARNEKIFEAVRNHGYKLVEVADHLSLHYSTISKILKNR